MIESIPTNGQVSETGEANQYKSWTYQQLMDSIFRSGAETSSLKD